MKYCEDEEGGDEQDTRVLVEWEGVLEVFCLLPLVVVSVFIIHFGPVVLGGCRKIKKVFFPFFREVKLIHIHSTHAV